VLSSVGGGLIAIVLGSVFVVLPRVDPSRFTRPWFARRIGQHIGHDEAEHMLERSARFNAKLYTLLGCVTIAVGGIAVIGGLVGAVD
jgi:hypothetical protein